MRFSVYQYKPMNKKKHTYETINFFFPFFPFFKKKAWTDLHVAV